MQRFICEYVYKIVCVFPCTLHMIIMFVCVCVSRENEVGMLRLVLFLIVCTVQYVCVCGGGVSM